MMSGKAAKVCFAENMMRTDSVSKQMKVLTAKILLCNLPITPQIIMVLLSFLSCYRHDKRILPKMLPYCSYRELSVFHPFCPYQSVSYNPDIFCPASYDDHLKAIMLIKMYMKR